MQLDATSSIAGDSVAPEGSQPSVPLRPLAIVRRPVVEVPVRSAHAIAALGVFYFMIVIRTAWVGDDAYITFRTIKHLCNGDGLTWNIGERVQAFTHPLWMFLLAGGYALTEDIYATAIGISVAVSVGTVVALMTKGSASLSSSLVVGALVVSSKAFVDYSTSGLENPLSHALLAAFLILFLSEGRTGKRLYWLGLLACLGSLTRLDTLIVYAPSLCAAFLGTRRTLGRRLLIVLASFLPLFVWETFSLLYYGFLLPNTAYAKLGTGIDTLAQVEQGFAYLLSNVAVDPLSSGTILVAVAGAFLSRRRSHVAIAVGVTLYLAYVVRVGGDFMLGRFITLPFLASSVLIAQSFASQNVAYGAGVAASVLLLSSVAPTSPLRASASESTNGWDTRGVADERAYYYAATGLLHLNRSGNLPDHAWRREGEKLKPGEVIQHGNVGFLGFFAPRDAHIIDVNALTDSLLARLPVRHLGNWRIGHFGRRVPEGYAESVRTGENRIKDARIAEFYGHLLTITKGAIFSRERFETIVRMNLGQYDGLLTPHRRQKPSQTTEARRLFARP